MTYFRIESNCSEPVKYDLIAANGHTTKYSIAETFFEVVKVWFDNNTLKAAGKKQGYHRGRRR